MSEKQFSLQYHFSQSAYMPRAVAAAPLARIYFICFYWMKKKSIPEKQNDSNISGSGERKYMYITYIRKIRRALKWQRQQQSASQPTNSSPQPAAVAVATAAAASPKKCYVFDMFCSTNE